MLVTQHARQRMRERRGTKGDADRVAERALVDGISYKDVTGRLHRYLTALHMQAGHEIRIYGNQVYVFDHTVLVTVLPLPSVYQQQVKKIRERKEHTDGL